ncbi:MULTISPECIES: peptide deformylase [Brevibacillus]|jgi:peptide deformylase|uniref:peptide deformylase n=1 Tax=Brevibacillus TaxID=55080 RepID=UPI00046A5932|nr:peptide deformylase [Brevibacillus borstelensis]MCC0564124.1 peptide deformylase [Brevibacillus borstelensis]MCM3470758.1 peptide deformylase [Brevibacillus borstelensis]MCM3558900.1 peptide deformylase [Brevibacillus borstelensis]MCM3592280.1 peptide deformylase [Brevibacillus borstelensis]MCM3622861.1 peptide deformylase [Brevibacillus borstelensis]
MAERMIVQLGDPILRERSRPVSPITQNVCNILDDMADTIYATEGRAGLSAIQIGIPKQLVVMDCGTGLIELINPVIVDSRGEQKGTEACLSIPGVVGIVKRAQYVKVKTLTRAGEEVVLEAEGFLARCVQHEIDHLHGILYIDYVNELYDDRKGKKLKPADANPILAHRRRLPR